MNPATKRIHRVASLLSEPLRAQGFRKKGLTFFRGDDAHVEVFEIQPSTYGNQGSFCVNLGVGFVALSRVKGLGTLWAAGRGIYATKWPRGGHPSAAGCTLRERLGMLLADRDLWWSVTGRPDLEAIAAEVLRAWNRLGVKWMKARQTMAAARRLAKKNVLLGGVLALAEGDRDTAQQRLTAALVGAPPMGVTELHALARKNGLTLG